MNLAIHYYPVENLVEYERNPRKNDDVVNRMDHKKVHDKNQYVTISKLNYVTLDHDFKKLDLAQYSQTTDPETATISLTQALSDIITKNTIISKVKKKDIIIKPWITPGLLKCIRNRDRLYKKHKSDPTHEINKITYTRYRNHFNKILKKVKKQFDTDELTKARSHPKKLWEAVKRITNTSEPTNIPTQLLTLNTPIQSCNAVNKFFASIGQELATNINTSRSTLSTPDSSTLPSPPHSFSLLPTDPDEVYTGILSLKPYAATGYDKISPSILKRFSKQLAPILTHIFNLCLTQGIFPTPLKTAIIHPIYKSGCRCSPTNYRPIAVLPALSKVLEKIINGRLINYLEAQNLLSPNQFGFRKAKSTQDAILRVQNEIVQRINERKMVLTVFLDLTKAFDTVQISTLILKLERLGVRGIQLDLFKSYLTNRSQIVRIGHHQGDPLPIEYGVPQGSILGPTLFLAFINDLCNLQFPNCSITTYADDTALLIFADSWSNLQTIAQNTIDKTLLWLRDHHLTLNTNKTKYIPFSVSTRTQPPSPISLIAHSCLDPISCKCPSIQPTDTIKYLGITLDKHLNYKTHILQLTARVRKLIFLFKTLRNITTSDVIRTTYLALCQSILSYSIACWGGVPKTTLKPLEIAQRAVLKVATNRPRLHPTYDLYQSCKVLTVRQLFILNTLVLQHKTTHYETPPQRRRRRDNLCKIPSIRLTFFKRFNYFLGPSLYNRYNYIDFIYPLSSYDCKNHITKYLMKQTYDETENFLSPYNL